MDIINGYGYGFTKTRPKPDPLPSLPVAQPTAEVAQTPSVQDFVDLDESSEEDQEGPQLVRKRTSSGEHPAKKLRFDDEAGPSTAQLE